MIICDFGHFQTIERREVRILFFENEEGQDWYELRRGLTEWDSEGEYLTAVFGTWAMVDPEGFITNVEYDPSRLMPGDRTILGIDCRPEEIKVGMTYKDGNLGKAAD